MNFYYENSNGRKIDLNKPPFMGVLCNNLFEFEWDYVTQGQAVQKIVKFEKYMKEKKFQVLLSGLDDHDYLSNLELFLQLTDVDINNLKMGKLWVDDYYLEGYIFASAKPKPYLNTTKTLIECSLICEKGNWQSEELYRFRPGYDDSEEHEDYTGYGIRYPYDYDYDYSAPFNSNTIVNESYLDTDFEITFYGMLTNPKVTIGGQVYEIKRTLGPDDYLKINSKTKTAIHIKQNGVEENVFAYRNKSYNLFEKIKWGGNLVIRPDTTKVDVKLFYERSEPKFTEAKWT
jgi:hypothetical protein